jgi:hypothetical protein
MKMAQVAGVSVYFYLDTRVRWLGGLRSFRLRMSKKGMCIMHLGIYVMVSTPPHMYAHAPARTDIQTHTHTHTLQGVKEEGEEGEGETGEEAMPAVAQVL